MSGAMNQEAILAAAREYIAAHDQRCSAGQRLEAAEKAFMEAVGEDDDNPNNRAIVVDGYAVIYWGHGISDVVVVVGGAP